MVLLRRGTWDAGIWSSILREYPTLPVAFEPGDIVLDAGCHTGAVCFFAAQRGATVVGYEASRENYAIAVLNLREFKSVSLHQAALWRSDLPESASLVFTPCAERANTGGGSVLYSSVSDHGGVQPSDRAEAVRKENLSTHAVEGVALDEVLEEIGPVRVLKLDVEGAEFPILLTARRLDLVKEMVGEYHEFSDSAMANLAPAARVGDERYTGALLSRHLNDSGFHVTLVPVCEGRGHFSAERL